MKYRVFHVDTTLGMPSILKTCRNLDALPLAETYELNFSRTQHFEPFGMLMLGSSIRRLCERDLGGGQRSAVVISGKSLSKQGHDYARRLGFWWSIGDEADIPSVMTTASSTTIPISRISYAEMFKEAGLRDPIRADIVGKAAADLATTLSGESEISPLWVALEYCFREMFRNAFEHGQTDSVWYAGATRKSKNDVQIAILDSGRGIKESLSGNPRERYQSDLEAIRAALRPGVSRNTYKKRSQSLTEKLMEEFPGQNLSLYDNSGYGLTSTSLIARDAGQFALISGRSCVSYVGNYETASSTNHRGTAVRIVLYPSKIQGVIDRILPSEKAGDGPRSGSLITASMLTRLGLRNSSPSEPPTP